ncbi:MAG: lysophospholipid acyltransferase family protein [Bacteroidia bacterium]|nr:1-acyl-sn-glycerol-3-phosphate acyltransferase [Bacteroidia bacterium]MDW8333473.1 lysophospholipid acyltransferase family protein [Bacteroidia bacterium]
MRTVLGRIWSVWVATVFFAVYLPLFPFYVLFLALGGKTERVGCHVLNQIWGRVFLALILIRVEARRNARLKPWTPYVFVGNHRSFMDIPATALVLPFIRYLGKEELAKIPIFGYMYRRLHIVVNRADKDARKRSMEMCDAALKRGDALFLFPEGTTKRASEFLVRQLYDGAFVLAVENQVPLVPVTTIHSDKVISNDGRFLMRPWVKVKVVIDEPIATTGLTHEDIPRLKERVAQLWRERLAPYYPGLPAAPPPQTQTDARIALTQ